MQLAAPCDESLAQLRKRSWFLTLNTSNIVKASDITSLLLIPPRASVKQQNTYHVNLQGPFLHQSGLFLDAL